MKRKIAIINIHDNVDISGNIIRYLDSNDEIYVFQLKESDFNTHSNIKSILVPSECSDSESKIKNYVTKFFFEENYKGFLHVIEDSVEIMKDPNTFLGEIEVMMSKLELKSWFNTITDALNYTFKIYNPRFSVDIDEPSVSNVYNKTIYWTSHANTSWICYNYSNSEFKDFEFDEKFKIPMYYIIKFLAERRNNKKKGELNYMNFYPTIDEEKGVFKNIKVDEFIVHSKEDHEKESKIFNEMNINHQADVTIEPIMDDIFEILKKKI